MQRRHLYWPILTTALLFGAQLISIEVAQAHRGHGGPAKVVMTESDALKTMLPTGDKILKRKEALKKEKYEEAVKQWGYSPSEGVYPYYISKGKNEELSGALFIQSFEYKHGSISLAVGYDKGGHVSDIKILSCPEKYVKELTEDVQSSGFLDGFLHLKTDEVITKAKAYDKESAESMRHLIAKDIGGTAILLKIFQGL